MASGLFAYYAEELLMTNPGGTDTPTLTTNPIWAVLVGDAKDGGGGDVELIDQARLEDTGNTNITQLKTLTSPALIFEDDLALGLPAGQDNVYGEITGGHAAALVNKRVGNTTGVPAPAAYVFTADNTDIVNAAAGLSHEKDVLMVYAKSTPGVVDGDPVLAWFDLANPPIPNGNTISIVWNSSGIFKFATVVPAT